MSRRKRGEKGTTYFDYSLLFILIFLLCFGLVMLYSSSSYTSANKYGDSAHYLKLQLRNILVGLVPMIFFAKVDYRIWRKFGTLAYLGSFFLCVLVMLPIPGLVRSSHGQSRWLNLGPLSFQPSELAKIAMIIFLAMLIEKIPKQLDKFSSIVKVGAILLPLLGVVAYNNLSTAVIIFAIAVCMLFVASPRYAQFIGVGIAGIAFVVVFILFASYRSDRVDAWLHPETAGDAGFQTLQGLYAIGSGKLFGKGLGQSLQKMGNVPEAQNDMIFSIICEELGLFGAICVVLLFLLLLWRMMIIANNAKDLYGALLVTGVMSHIAIQVILNIAVVTNTIPNTGVILPFISYGGTSLVFLMGEMGLVLSVSKGIRLETIESIG
ncbi:MAG: putative peptidoglycan glycosyltransferase FtsW [Lachnospiraceae bacterium]|nr:putative lipid II flippase FtsW [Agathobacter sp.]MDD6291393.1 putative peptidoglycan glycosyltransferase FtsW [Lachnospiraceae bacterium]